MLRAILAFLLMAAVGAAGYYFWSAAEHPAEAAYRARQDQARTPPKLPKTTQAPRDSSSSAAVPNVDTGGGAALPQIPVPPVQGASNLGTLGDRHIGFPIADLRTTDLIDTFDQARDGGDRRHEATDILAPRGTPVLAVDDGIVKKLFNSKPGGITVYQYDPTEHYCYYYAHLDRYADNLKEGQQVRRGDVLGYVGSTGNANANTPHLHFAILQLGPNKEWWQDTTPVNAYPIFMGAITASRTR